jgi:hypothetical protein
VRKYAFAVIALTVLLSLALIAGCDKERIVESTEYIENTEYIEVPGDTVFRVDTVYSGDSVVIIETDTVTVNITDTVTVTDTVVQTDHDTVTIIDTVVTVENHYDTTVIIDTVETVLYSPNEYLAIAAVHYFNDPLVIDLVNQEFGLTDGWIFYLSSFQLDLTKQSSDVYDIYGYIDYWTPDWSAYYPLEFYWRVTYTGGDPGDPNNWTLSNPPGATSASRSPGVNIVSDAVSSGRPGR